MLQLQLRDGAQLAYRDAGSGPALLLLHGWSMRKEAFAAQFQALDARFRVVAPDLRGHGASSKAVSGTDLKALADDVTELVLALDLTDIVVVGWSMGAIVAWTMLKGEAAARIRGIVVVDMVPRILSDPDWPYGLREGTDSSSYDPYIARMRQDWPAFTSEYIPGNVARGREQQRSALLARLYELVEHNDPESMAVLWRALAEVDLRNFVAQLDLPTLISYGERGQLYSSDAFAWLHDHITNSRRVSFADSGHAPHMEEPDKFNDVLAEFADRLNSEAATAMVNGTDI
ncbi:MAG TPA: alpha/beta hydrolase [Woeseiaceae bacterium]|nr:alpha/beta hydrolase [Woeseiaceae bacterium]